MTKTFFLPFCAFLLMSFSGLKTQAISLEGEDPLAKAKAECSGNDKAWNDLLNTCLTTQQAQDLRDQAQVCAQSEDPENCFMQEAQKQTGVQKGQKSKNSPLAMIGQMAAGAYALFSAVTLSSSISGAMSTSQCTSKYIFMGTSVAWMAGDFFLKSQSKKGFKTLAERYAQEQANTDQLGGENGSFQAQMRAFAYLKQEQEEIKKQAERRGLLQMAVTMGFGAALGFAIYESTNPAIACLPAAEATPPANPEAALPSGAAAGGTGGATAGAAAAVPGVGMAAMILQLGTSPQIAVASGVMLALNAYLIFHANGEKKRAQNNIKSIDEVIAAFQDMTSGYCPNGRDDVTDARCYCYAADGSKNANRTNSATCQNLFNAVDMDYALLNPATPTTAKTARQGCLTVTGQFDEDCRCRQMINNTTKQNACAKMPQTTALNSALGTQLGAQAAMNTLGQLPNGANLALASLNGSKLASQATRQRNLIGQIADKAKAQGASLPPKSFMDAQGEKLALRAGTSQALKDFSQNFGGGSLAARSLRPENLAQALEKAEEKSGITSLIETPLTATHQGKGAVGGKPMKFNWNDSGASGGNKVTNFMDKNYQYKDADINKREDVSLWHVISNRYQTSGLRRLFEDE